MKVLVVGSNSPAKINIITSLNLCLNVQITDSCPSEILFANLEDVDCSIYIDSSPNINLIDQLRKIRKPLVLVASAYCRSDLFISLNAFNNATTATDAICQIRSILNRLEHIPELGNLPPRQKEILSLVLVGKTKEEIIDMLGICPRTYQKQLDKARSLFGVTSNEKLISNLHLSGIAAQIIEHPVNILAESFLQLPKFSPGRFISHSLGVKVNKGSPL